LIEKKKKSLDDFKSLKGLAW